MIDEIDCLRPVAERHLRPGVTWDAMLREATARVAGEIARRGVFRISERKGVLVCRA